LRCGSCGSGGRGGARAFAEEAALGVLALLADVEAGHRAVVAHHPRPDLAALAVLVAQRSSGGRCGIGGVVHAEISSWKVTTVIDGAAAACSSASSRWSQRGQNSCSPAR